MGDRKDSMSAGLKVLTIHGDGLQGLGILSILDELCSRIATKEGLSSVPRPCQMFDAMCGTGIGALLAVLLGRYGLDVSTCKQIYRDLAEFVEEKQATKRTQQTRKIEEEDGLEFLEMLLNEEGWSDRADVPADREKSRCQHVFVVHAHKHQGHKLVTEVLHSSNEDAFTRRASAFTPPKPLKVSKVVAAALAHGVDDWRATHSGSDTEFEARVPHVHGIVFAAVDEIMVSHPASSSIELLIDVGPRRTDPYNNITSSRMPRSPAQWVMEKSSRIKSVVMWPLKLTKRTLVSHTPSTAVPQGLRRRSSVQKPRARSLSLRHWPMQAVSRSTNDRAAEERRELVQEQVQQLVDGAAQGRLLSFCTTIAALNDEASDMSDLKETRTSIKEIVAFMDGSGLLDEAADGLGQS